MALHVKRSLAAALLFCTGLLAAPPAHAFCGLYVAKVGREREEGRGGWVYKVGRRAGTAGAADPAGSFGTGRLLRHGQRVTWFWCELQASGSCQRTLEARPDRRAVRPGEALRVTARRRDGCG